MKSIRLSIFLLSVLAVFVSHGYAPRWSRRSTSPSVSRFQPLMAPLPSTSQQQEQDEIIKYRNRATLTEHILKNRTKEFKLLQAKVTVLQDVVQRMKLHAKTTEQSQSALLQEQDAERQQLAHNLTSLTLEFEQAKVEFAKQKSSYEDDIERLLSELDKSKKQKSSTKEGSDYEQQIQALKQEVLDVDQNLETTQEELQRLRKDLETQQREADERLQQERKQLRQEIETLVEERNALRQELANQTQVMQERMDIAQAAVAAAERREEDLLARLDKMGLHLDELAKERDLLLVQDALQGELRAEIEDLEAKLSAVQSKHILERQIDAQCMRDRLQALRREYEMRSMAERVARGAKMSRQHENARGGGLWSRLKRKFRR